MAHNLGARLPGESARLMVAADECPLGAVVPLPAGFVAPVSWFVEKLAVGDLR